MSLENNSIAWWSIPKEELLKQLNSNTEGLSQEIVEKNRKIFGANILEKAKKITFFTLIFESLKEPMMLLLLSIGALSLFFGKPLEALVMVFVVGAYIFVECLNKFKAEKINERLKELSSPTTKVLRSGKFTEIKTEDLVVGDIAILSVGDPISADMRLIDAAGLIINEAPLSGESFPVFKDANAKIEKTALLTEQKTAVFSGTTVLSGEAKAIVVRVGKDTEWGKISSSLLSQRKEKTPIQKSMLSLAKTLALLAILVSILIPLIGFIRGQNPQAMILTWLSLTFLMIPGQPPIIITMALALASFELAQKKLVVKRLRGVESLGQINAIITDKTGTITENKMRLLHFIGSNGSLIEPRQMPKDLEEKISLCLPEFITDPTDSAVFDAINNLKKSRSYIKFANFGENPWRVFTYKSSAFSLAFSGQGEKLIELSSLSQEDKKNLLGCIAKEAGDGNRVIGFAFKESDNEKIESLQFLALAVLVDPVRAGVKETIENLKKSKIETYIVTGDHPNTASKIAKEINLESALLTGSDIEKMDDQTLLEKLKNIKVFARILPSQKVRLVNLLKKEKSVCAIGDGVNDAPAIKTADLGIAMGEIGTNLAKESADIILADDNFVHIYDAIAIGRKALDNFRKGLTYYLTAKAILLFIFIIPLILKIPFPFAPIHIILTELLMDLASSTIFTAEKAEIDLMDRPQQITSFLNRKIFFKILKGSFLALGILAVYLWTYHTVSLQAAQTSAFVTWLLGHIMLALNLKQEKLPLLKQGLFSNRFGAFWLIAMIFFSLIITTIPSLYPIFKTAPIPLNIWGVIIVVVICSTCWIEALKFIRYYKDQNTSSN